MNAIRKITKIINNSITFKELKEMNGKEVEVIILPIYSNNEKTIKKKKNLFFNYEGSIESTNINTSLNVDQLIYGK